MFFKLVLLLLSSSCSCLCVRGDAGHAGPWAGRGDRDVDMYASDGDSIVHTVTRKSQGRSPVILVPGLGGSQLWAKLTGKRSRPHWFCKRTTSDYFNIWLSLTEMLPMVIDCTLDNFRLHYDAKNHVTRNTQGVDIQPLHFGHPRSIEWLTPYFDKAQDTRKTFLSRGKGAVGRGGGDGGVGVSSSSSSSSSSLYRARTLLRKLEEVSAAKLLGDASHADVWLAGKTTTTTTTTTTMMTTTTTTTTKKKKKTTKMGNDINNKKSMKEGRVLGGGGVLTAPALRFRSISDLAYFSDLVKELVSNGYTRGVDVMAAPYDFRKAPNEMQEFFNKTKRLIEDTYARNGNSSVVVVAHSMGNPVMLYFYNHVVSQDWKDRHVRSHVALSAPWGGAIKALKLMCSGEPMGLKYVKATAIRSIQRSMPSVAWLLPSRSLWPPHQVVVTTPRRNYTVSHYRQLFRDLDYDDGFRMWLDTRDLVSDLKFPGVEMHCLYGVGVKTPGRLVYKGEAFPDHAPEVEADDGDGTVNRRSLEAFIPWQQQQQQQHGSSSRPVKSLRLEQVSHIGILKDRQAIQYVLNVASRRP
ncbi:lysosomal phospholipase A and acyltransferase-like [Babylonia areolata]|uniref:lysosomal phospholipase A and acyltransferase-like n=1 Tax=Babylonia areolata TaxID=304850 RepID=UPI003FD06D48